MMTTTMMMMLMMMTIIIIMVSIRLMMLPALSKMSTAPERTHALNSGITDNGLKQNLRNSVSGDNDLISKAMPG